MQSTLTSKSIFQNWQVPVMFLIFFGIRALSFLLVDQMIIQAILVFLILMTLGILYFKNPDWAFYLVLGELFLGGSGHYLEFINLSIRALLIITFILLWTLYAIGNQKLLQNIDLNKKFSIILFVFYLFLIISIISGIRYDHAVVSIIQDLIPFLYLPLLFPAYHLLSKPKTQEYFIRLLIVFLISSAVFSLFTFILFSTGIVELQEPFYKWFRDVSMGKITNMGAGFFRVVLPEHLLITPIILIISSLLMRDEKHHKMWRFLLFLASIILVINLSRIYFVAIIVGLIVLKYKHLWKRWFIISTTTLGLIFLIFTSLFLISSGGKSLGLELFGIRISSIASPHIEESSATRIMIFPEALKMIGTAPILGQGLGASITFLNTVTYKQITTRQFDWGYLEMMVELGILGSLALVSFIFFAIWKLIEKINHAPDWHDFYVGLLASIVAFLIINITSPAIFHVFGIFFFVFTLAIALQPMDIFDRLINILYRIFNRIEQ